MSTNIHPTAIVDQSARIGEGVTIGPYCIVGPNVSLGEQSHLHSHVVIDGHTVIGARNKFYPFACIGLQTQDLKYKGGTTHLEVGSDNVFREHVSVHRATDDGLTTRIGSHNHLLAYAHVAHDCVVGNHVVFSNCGTLAGHVTVEDHAVIGGLAAIHQFCRVGQMSIIGGCAKVVQDVPPYMMVDGNPGVIRGINKIGMERKGVADPVIRSLREAYKIVCREGLTVRNALDKVSAELPHSQELEHFVDFCRSSERGIAR